MDVIRRKDSICGEFVYAGDSRCRYSVTHYSQCLLRWEFAMAHDIILPDEYDRVHLDLAPFFALPREEMHKRVEEVQKLPETYTLSVKQGRVTIEVSLSYAKLHILAIGLYPHRTDVDRR
jgi:hypothetical protein